MIGVKNQQYLKEFGKNLRKLRKKKKLSMKHLADLANLEYSQIARIEAGKINRIRENILDIHYVFFRDSIEFSLNTSSSLEYGTNDVLVDYKISNVDLRRKKANEHIDF